MSDGKKAYPCNAFRLWPGNDVCGNCGWHENEHGEDTKLIDVPHGTDDQSV